MNDLNKTILLFHFIHLPNLVALKMLWTKVLLVLGLSMSHSATDAIACRGGVIYGVHAGGAGEEFYDLECTGPNFEDLCHVMYADNRIPQFDNHFQFGCLEKGSLHKCGKILREHGVDNYYCCCMDANCNTKDFAAKCGSVENVEKMKSEEYIVTLEHMKPSHYEL